MKNKTKTNIILMKMNILIFKLIICINAMTVVSNSVLVVLALITTVANANVFQKQKYVKISLLE